MATLLNNLGDHYKAEGDMAKAVKCYKKAAEIYEHLAREDFKNMRLLSSRVMIIWLAFGQI